MVKVQKIKEFGTWTLREFNSKLAYWGGGRWLGLWAVRVGPASRQVPENGEASELGFRGLGFRV